MSNTEQSDLLLSVHDLSVDFRLEGNAVLHAVQGISFDVPGNTTVALVGESGSGKSVTALAILGLLPRNSAMIGAGSQIEFGGRDLLKMSARELRGLRGRQIGMIFQEPMSSLNPVYTAGYQIAEVITTHLGLSHKQARARAIELLNEVGIPDPRRRVDDYPHQLSGGQQQRVMIAMAVACEPRLLIADEPTTALDFSVQKQILTLIQQLQLRRRMSVLLITHDLSVVAQTAHQVVVMRDGAIREHGSVTQIFSSPQDHYTKALLACRPPRQHRPQRLPVIEDFIHGTVAIGERPRGLSGDEQIVLEAKGLTKSFYARQGMFGRREFKVVNNVSFRIAKGKTLGVVGESGSGKTTLALTAMRLHDATRGEVVFDGRDLLSMTPQQMMACKRRIQIVFQNPYASLNPRFTIGQTLVEPMQIHGIGLGHAARQALAREMLDKVGLPQETMARYPHEFSGGQRQRIAIARCLVLKPEVLICDEAVSALDVSVQAQLLNLLQDLQDEYGMSYLFISHDLAVVRYISDEVMVMKDGEIVEIAGSDEIYANPRHPYTKMLLSSMLPEMPGQIFSA